MTNNGEVNLVVAQRAIEEFSPPRVLAIFPRDSQVSVLNSRVEQAFSSQILLEVWNQHLNDGAVKLGETILKEAGLDLQQAHLRALVKAGSLMPLLIERSGSLQITPAEGEWQVGDRLIYLLYNPKPKLLKRLSGSSQQQLTLEELPEVELIPLPEPVLNGAIEAVQSFVTDVADS